MGKNGLDLTQRELLVRIDERQQRILEKIKCFETKLDGKVEKDDDFQRMEERVDQLWDWKNKVIGWATAAGAISSIVFSVLEKLITKYIEK